MNLRKSRYDTGQENIEPGGDVKTGNVDGAAEDGSVAALDLGLAIAVIPFDSRSIGVDTPADVARVEAEFLEKKLRYEAEIASLSEHLTRARAGTPGDEDVAALRAAAEETGALYLDLVRRRNAERLGVHWLSTL